MLLIIFFSLFCLNSFSQEIENDTKNLERDSIIAYAKQFVGTPYLWGGSSSKGFDCSGFIYHVFKHFNISVSRTSRGYADKGEEVSMENSLPGDVILFTGTNSAVRQIGHVGLVLSNEDGIVNFVHSSSSKKHYGVTVTRYNESGYVKRFLRVINVLI